MAEPLTPAPILHPISETPSGLTPRPWARYFDAVRTQVLALVTWQEGLLATTPPPAVAATSQTGTAETAARGDHTHADLALREQLAALEARVQALEAVP